MSEPARASMVLLAVAMALTGCDSPSEAAPTPGEVEGVLESPDGNEGGMVAELVGPDIEEVRVFTGNAFTHQEGDTTRLVIIRPTGGTIRFRAEVPNVHEPPEARLLEVTDQANEAPPSLSDYRIEFAPVAEGDS